MPRIETTCPTCGTVVCDPRDFELRQWLGTGVYYLFNCPRCGELVQRRADERAIEILTRNGARRVYPDMPLEMAEPHPGPPITLDDVLDLHQMLQRPDWFDGLRTSTRPDSSSSAG